MLDDCFESATDDEVVVRVHVQPGAGRSAVVGKHGNALKVRVAAPPVEGRANEALLALFVNDLGLKADQVTLLSGESSRSKRVKVTGVDGDDLKRLLDEAVAAGNASQGRDVRRSGR